MEKKVNRGNRLGRFGMLAVVSFGFAATGTAAPAASFQTAQPPQPVAAAAAEPSQALRTRSDQLVDMFNGKRSLQDFFGPGVPAAKFEQTLSMVRDNFGAAVSVSGLEAATANSGTVTVKFERGERRMKLRVDEKAPHNVNGFGSAN